MYEDKHIKLSQSEIDDFFENNAYLSQFAGARRAPRRKRRLVYRKVLTNNMIFDSFQVDLWQTKRDDESDKFKYVLVCIDTVSRFVIAKELADKEKTNIIRSFDKIIQEIRIRKIDAFKGIQSYDNISFISDLGELYY